MVRARTVALLLCAAAVATLAYADDEPYEARPDADAEPETTEPEEPKIPEGPKFDYMDPDTWSRAVWTLFTWRLEAFVSTQVPAGAVRLDVREAHRGLLADLGDPRGPHERVGGRGGGEAEAVEEGGLHVRQSRIVGL